MLGLMDLDIAVLESKSNIIEDNISAAVIVSPKSGKEQID